MVSRGFNMDAHKLWMLRDFIGTNKVLFRIPVYQRNYDWAESNCDRLLDDINDIISSGDKHFLGTIVFMAAKNGGFALQDYIIIDGQQRLTTLMLMLKALSNVAKDVGDDCYHEIEEQYLHNKYCDEEFKVKLKPIKSDNIQFLLLLENKEDEMDEDTHIYRNYIRCSERFNHWVEKGINPSQILDALTKLEIVEIVLAKGEDDPQVIFESINSTGLELTNADLIRNFLLMNAENQEELYENYWVRIEKSLRKNMDYSKLDDFFTLYIMYKTSKPVKSRQLYSNFVKLFKDCGYTQEGMLKELRYYAEIYEAFVYDSKKYSCSINRSLWKLRVLNQSTCYPFLLHLFDDFSNGVIDEKTVEEVLKLIVSYLLRRLVCGVPSNSLRGLFIYLYNRLFKVISNKQKYYQTLNKFLFSVSSKDVVPSESEFDRALQKANVYGNIALCRFLLLDIENGDSKETLSSENLTIEHIMPQTLSADWNYIKPEEHEEFVHTLGNLSVTGYNSELSNKSFLEKKAIIQENSKAVILNCDVIDKKSWTIRDIKNRAKRLAKIILERYKIDKVDDSSIEFDYVEPITLDDYNDITGKKLVSFKLFGEIYRQKRYALMLLDVIKILDKKVPGKLEDLAEKNYSFSSTKRKHVHINTDGKGMRWAWKVKENVYLEANLSAWACMRFIENLLYEYGIQKDEFIVYIIAEETTDDGIDEE